MRMFENQLERDAAVLNADDPEVTQRSPARPHLFWFSRQKRVAEGAFLQDEQIVFRQRRRGDVRWRGETKFRCAVSTTSKTSWPPASAAYLGGAEPACHRCTACKTFPGSRASAGICRRNRRREVLQRFEGHQCGRRTQGHRSFSEQADRDSGRQRQGQPLTPLRELLRRARAAWLLIGAAAEKIAADLGDVVPIERAGTLERAIESRLNVRGRATWCCSLRRAPASINLRITSTAGASSRNWCAQAWKSVAAAATRKDKDASQPATRSAAVSCDAGAVPDGRGDGVQRLGHDRARAVR